MKKLELRGVPTIIFAAEGREAAPRLTGDKEAVPEKIEKTIQLLL